MKIAEFRGERATESRASEARRVLIIENVELLANTGETEEASRSRRQQSPRGNVKQRRVLANRRGKTGGGPENRYNTYLLYMLVYSQVVLPLERLAAHRAHVFPLVAVRQLVLRERRCVVEHLPADLRQKRCTVSARLCNDLPRDSRLDCVFSLPA